MCAEVPITLDPDSAEPPFEQVKRQVRELVDAGRLVVGDKLPTVRRLAETLGIAPNTVGRAYRELEAEGVIRTQGRSGTFVAGDDAERVAREAALEYLRRVNGLGMSGDDAVAILRDLSTRRRP